MFFCIGGGGNAIIVLRMLGATGQNIAVCMSRHMRFVHPCVTQVGNEIVS